MLPIIKWSGGKSQELKHFSHKFPPKINRYIEPFLGGGSVYFYLDNKNSIINDINFEIIILYSIISSDRLNIFINYLNDINNIRENINEYFKNIDEHEIDLIFNHEKTFIKINFNNMLDLLIMKSIKDKVKRIKNIENKENKKFNKEELKEHIQTACQSALYFYCRYIYNSGNKTDLEYYIANWYYVREFCYSSMFRFSKEGKFNIPYGGIGYNNKNFKLKIDNLKNDNLICLLKETKIECLDFEKLFEKYNYFNKDDFIFIDPPYDSEFSQYNKEADFDKNEQVRLFNVLLKSPAKIMIVIKETDFIYNLYKNNFKIEAFDKKYLTNMRNRNNKDVKHLIITNY